MTYRISIKSHLEHLWIIILLVLLTPFLISSVLVYEYDIDLPLILWMFVIVFFIIPKIAPFHPA